MLRGWAPVRYTAGSPFLIKTLCANLGVILGIRHLVSLSLLAASLGITVAGAAPEHQDSAQGGRLYAALACAACHGDRAQGLVGPRLAGTDLTYDQVLHQVRNGGNGMPNFGPGAVTDQQVMDIYAYVRELGGRPAMDAPPAEMWPGMPAEEEYTPAAPDDSGM
jgi:mono/diheme cytochrome c family protein